MRWFLIAALIAVLVLDTWFARHAANEEIGSATKYNNIKNYQQRSIEGPFIIGARDIFIGFTKFAEDNEGAITALSTLAIAIFTVVLAAATIGLWRAADQQKADMRESLRIASESAKAALVQANTAMSAERGYAKISHYEPLDITNVLKSVRLRMQVKNWGRTPVQVISMSLIMHIRDSDNPLPPIPPYGQAVPNSVFLVTMEDCAFAIPASPGEHYSAVQDGTKVLYLIGYVDYTDKFRNEHRGGYARKYDPEAHDLLFVTQEGYNYDRVKEKGEDTPS